MSSVEVERADSPYTSLHVYGSLVQVTMSEGDTIGFTARNATTFDPEVGSDSLKLVYTTSTDRYTLTNQDGSVVVFSRVTGASVGSYHPTSVTVPAGQAASLSWERLTVNGTEVIRPTRMLAGVPGGVSCVTVTRGCRAVNFTYATATTATGTTEAGWGDHLGRLREITFTAWDPDLATPAMRTVVVSRYAYDNAGRLRAAWDPRQDWIDGGVNRQARTLYGYNADGVLATITPKGQDPWHLAYTTIPGDPGKGRLHQVTRTALAAGTATQTVVYKVPTTGSGAPYDLSPTQTSRWGQEEAPTDATAVFRPDQLPNGNPASGTLPTSYQRATVTYMDANARLVNTAKPGGHIDTTWYDRWGNNIQTLTAANRHRALSAHPTDDAAAESGIARRLSTLDTYTADGQRVDTTLEPERDVILPNGDSARGRKLTRFSYDEGAPVSDDPYNLVTTKTEMVRVWAGDSTVTDSDERTTTTAYNWSLQQPTAETVDPAGLALTTRTEYDPATGHVTSTTTPGGGTSTTTPATLKVIHYRAGTGSGHSECDNRPEWAGIPCREQSGGQAASGPEVPTKVTTYNMFGQTRSVTEKNTAGVLRTVTTTYDSAGRIHEKVTTAATSLGTQVPIERNVYDPPTGLLLRSQSVTAGTVAAEIIRSYDSLGRLTSYTDADGVTSNTTYDLLGRKATTHDGKALRTYTYSGETEHRDLLTSVNDSQAGVFTGSYDPDGNLTGETWPDGITVTRGIDEAGSTNSINYEKRNCSTGDCTLLLETTVASVHGQIRTSTSTLANTTYHYDKAGRLTRSENRQYGECITRQHQFDAASNRTTWSVYAPDDEGECSTTGAIRARTWSHDTADRKTVSSGYTYDQLGRTTAIPGNDSANSADPITVAYHSSSMVRSLEQGSRTAEYTVDVTGERIRSWQDSMNGTTASSVNHYDGDRDAPSWTQETPSHYTRPIKGVAGMVGIFSASDGQVSWQIEDLREVIVASVQEQDEGLSIVHGSDEYGLAYQDSSIGQRRYGWYGTSQRAADTPAGIVLMGVRLYNPLTGSFLTPDPVYGGNAGPYEYCFGDPVNCSDVSGKGSKCKWPRCGRVINSHWVPTKIARDRCGAVRLCAKNKYKWLQVAQSSRRYFQDTDSYRFFGIWYPINDGWTAVVHGSYHIRSPH
ncbi:RHS repeat-associated core domain-containing protein [Micromonospora sp. SH-82]|uniref:RHS repeat-associated core domain-containing protein n=1 Tax=Micromonospora sp. SH-82 TaxID=3132938 RepID=UPI003EB6D875